MEPSDIQFVGAPCGQHGPYTFYKAFRYQRGEKVKILSLGEFFYVKILKDAPVCIGELQLLWEDRNHLGVFLASVRLYFLPQDTPDGRHSQHGEDEILGSNEKVVLKVDDLLKWVPENGVRWTHGLRAIRSDDVAPDPDSKDQLIHAFTANNLKLQLSDVNTVKKSLGLEEETGRAQNTEVFILSYPQYCRYRTVLKRLQGCENQWLKNAVVSAIGGFTAKSPNARILFCRETFDHPELEDHEFRQDEHAPNLKGRPRKKKLTLKKGSGLESDSGESTESEKVAAIPPCKNKPAANHTLVHHSFLKPPMHSKERRRKTSSELHLVNHKGRLKPDEEDFLRSLYRFMKGRCTPIGRLPTLGFKEIDPFHFYTYAQKLGGYDQITQKRLWKQIYDKMGGNPSNTSAATCTRRQYEKLLLPYERYIRGEIHKPLPKPYVKPKKLHFAHHQPVPITPGEVRGSESDFKDETSADGKSQMRRTVKMELMMRNKVNEVPDKHTVENHHDSNRLKVAPSGHTANHVAAPQVNSLRNPGRQIDLACMEHISDIEELEQRRIQGHKERLEGQGHSHKLHSGSEAAQAESHYKRGMSILSPLQGKKPSVAASKPHKAHDPGHPSHGQQGLAAHPPHRGMYVPVISSSTAPEPSVAGTVPQQFMLAGAAGSAGASAKRPNGSPLLPPNVQVMPNGQIIPTTVPNYHVPKTCADAASKHHHSLGAVFPSHIKADVSRPSVIHHSSANLAPRGVLNPAPSPRPHLPRSVYGPPTLITPSVSRPTTGQAAKRSYPFPAHSSISDVPGIYMQHANTESKPQQQQQQQQQQQLQTDPLLSHLKLPVSAPHSAAAAVYPEPPKRHKINSAVVPGKHVHAASHKVPTNHSVERMMDTGRSSSGGATADAPYDFSMRTMRSLQEETSISSSNVPSSADDANEPLNLSMKDVGVRNGGSVPCLSATGLGQRSTDLCSSRRDLYHPRTSSSKSSYPLGMQLPVHIASTACHNPSPSPHSLQTAASQPSATTTVNSTVHPAFPQYPTHIMPPGASVAPPSSFPMTNNTTVAISPQSYASSMNPVTMVTGLYYPANMAYAMPQLPVYPTGIYLPPPSPSMPTSVQEKKSTG